MESEWKSVDDFDRDIRFFSEISEHDNDDYEPPTDPILQFNARIGANHNSSIFDNHILEDGVAFMSSGRGRGGISTVFKPGIPVKDSKNEEQKITDYIRQVSGLGYSNELIERTIRKTTPLPLEQEFCDIPEKEELRLNLYQNTPEKSKSSSSSIASPVNSKSTSPSLIPPNKSKTVGTQVLSPRRTPVTSPKKVQSVRHTPNLNLTPSSSTPTEEKSDHPLPLSVMLNMGKKKAPPRKPNVDKEDSASVKNFHLNPDAPEFKSIYSSSNGSLEQYSEDSEIDSSIGNGDYFTSNSSGDELSWRKRDRHFNQPSSVPYSQSCLNITVRRSENNANTSFSGATSNWRIRDGQTFNINSSYDFPAL